MTFLAKQDWNWIMKRMMNYCLVPMKSLKKIFVDILELQISLLVSLRKIRRKHFIQQYLAIRAPLNAQRDYQGVTIQVWRKK